MGIYTGLELAIIKTLFSLIYGLGIIWIFHKLVNRYDKKEIKNQQ